VADARALLLWAVTVLLGASYSRNPLYSLLLLLMTLWVYDTAGAADVVSASTGSGRPSPLAPLRFALIAVPLGALFNALTSHFGATVLLRLPAWLPLLGGALTLEALAFGAINGLNLTVIFSGFAAFNQAVATRELLKLTPRAFHESGVVLSIALTFIPQTTHSLHRIREAQAVRGHRLRGLRDWLPIFTPLLVSALERALGLAEAMVARGYASVTDTAQPLRTQGLLALGLLVLLGGWLGYLFTPALRPVLLGVGALGVALMLTALWLAGRGNRHTVYRPRRWRAQDTWIVAGCLLALGTLLSRRAWMVYSPYPQLAWPNFDPLTALGLLGLLVPGLIPAREKTRDAGEMGDE